MKTGAIVWGGHFHALGLVRQLARFGIPVVVIDHEYCIARFSKYTWKFFKSPIGDDENTCLDFFKNLARNYRLHQWVVFPSDDQGVFFLSRNKTALENYFRITTPRWDVTKFVYDKRQTYLKASSIGLPVPRTMIPKSREEIFDLDWEYPLIIKPAIMRTFKAMTGKKAFRANNRDELIQLYDRACQFVPCDEVLIQDEIPQAYRHLYSFCPWFKDGKTLSYVIAKRLRQHPMEFGHASTYAVTMDIPELKDKGSQFLKSFDFYGICEVEFIFDVRDSQFKMLEVNPRIWGWHTIAEAAGLPLGYFLFMDQTGTALQKTGYRLNQKWIRLLTDIPTSVRSLLDGKISFSEYISSIRGEIEFAVLSLDDPLPFLAELLMIPYLWKKRGF